MNHTMEMDLRKMTDEFKSRSEAQVITETTAWCFVILIAFVGNLLTLLILYKNPVLRTSTNMFIASLAFSDVGHVISSGIPLGVPTLAMSRWPFSKSVCQYNGFIVLMFIAASILTLGWTAVNRFYRVVKPSKYKYFFSTRRTAGIILLTWFLAMLAPIPYLASGNLFVFHPAKFFCYLKLNSGPFTAFLASTYIGIPAAAVFYCYLRIYLEVRRHNAQVFQSNTVGAEEIKITKALFVMVFAFICCWTPILLIDLIDTFSGQWIMPRWVYVTYSFTGMISSSLNPVIYVVMNVQFRKEYARMLKCEACGKEGHNIVHNVNRDKSTSF